MLNIHDFKAWLTDNEKALRSRVASWIPSRTVRQRTARFSLRNSSLIASRRVEDAIQFLPEEKAQAQ